MSRRFPCSIPGCPVCRPLRAVDRWAEDWDRAARRFDHERRRDATRRAKEQLRRLIDEATRARREDDPTVN